MSIKENILNITKSEGVREAEKIAQIHLDILQGDRATEAYLRQELSIEQYGHTLEDTSPLTKMNPRKLASDKK